MLEVSSTRCCAMNQIHNLHHHLINGKDGKMVFDGKGALKKIFGVWLDSKLRYAPKTDSSDYRIHRHCSGHYIFAGVINLTGDLERERKSPGCADLTYGPKFAAFIKRNKLGTLASSLPEINRINHPEHTVKVWVWTPDPDALAKWFEKEVFPEELVRMEKERVEMLARQAAYEAERNRMRASMPKSSAKVSVPSSIYQDLSITTSSLSF